MIDKREMQYLYRSGDDYVFMDNTSYDQLTVSRGQLGESAHFLIESATAVLKMYGDEIVGVELPAAVDLTIAETEPGIQGDRVSGARKPATLETGLVIQVPLFVNPGDRVKVDTRSGEYITRS
jgi:elongation factor P